MLLLQLVPLLLLSCLLVLTQAGSGSVVSNYTASKSEECLANLAASLQRSCNMANEAFFQRIATRSYAACMEANEDKPQLSDQANVIMVPTRWYPALKSLVDAKPANTAALAVQLLPVQPKQLLPELMFQLWNDIVQQRYGWVFYDSGDLTLTGLQASGALTDLTHWIAADPGLQWEDVPAVYRAQCGALGRTFQLPMDLAVPTLHYRTDLLAQQNLTAPRTWSELLYQLGHFNGTDLNGDGTLDYGICMAAGAGHSAALQYMVLAATILQYQGPSQGALLDPATLKPLFNSSGGIWAMQLLQQIMSHSQPFSYNPIDDDVPGSVLYARGRCAFLFDLGEFFKDLELGGNAYNSSFVKGKTGTVVIPGSEEVYDRQAGVMRPCTMDLCPLGLNNVPELIQRQQDGILVYVNRAAFIPRMGTVAVLTGGAPEQTAKQTLEILSYFAGPEVHKQLAFSAGSTVMPFRTSLLQLDQLPLYVQAGFDSDDATQWILANQLTVNSQNTAGSPPAESWVSLSETLAQVISYVLAGAAIPPAMDEVQSFTVEHVIGGGDPTSAQYQYFRAIYWAQVGYVPPQVDDGSSTDLPPVALAVPIVTAVVVVVLSTIYEFNKRRHHRNLFGKVVAPGPGDDTTLLVTDIQDSTVLWELLPSHVMDKAIKEHHECIRRLLLKHSGYESATEGDSFILAFHCPEDALLFAMEAQAALLECQWPSELVDMEACRPFYAAPVVHDKLKAMILDSSNALGGMEVPSGSDSDLHASCNTSHCAINFNVVGGGPSTFSMACQAGWKEAAPNAPNSVLLFKGIRVRIGMHTGIHNVGDVSYNKAAARVQYAGEPLKCAKCVCDAATGGMVLISAQVYRRLPMERLWDKAMVMHSGEYALGSDLTLDLYQVLGRRILGRLAFLGPIRFKEQLSQGVMSAPLGPVAMAYVSVVGAGTLLAWSPEVAGQALDMMHQEAAASMAHHGGYLVESSPEHLVVVFHRAAEALVWALGLHRAMLDKDWPHELLDHELCEELVVGDTVVFRGLRLKTGVDVGSVVGEVNAMTARIAYRGRVVNRVAKVMQMAASNQVLCTSEAWSCAQASQGLVAVYKLSCEPLGPFKLKGVVDKVELLMARSGMELEEEVGGLATVPSGTWDTLPADVLQEVERLHEEHCLVSGQEAGHRQGLPPVVPPSPSPPMSPSPQQASAELPSVLGPPGPFMTDSLGLGRQRTSGLQGAGSRAGHYIGARAPWQPCPSLNSRAAAAKAVAAVDAREPAAGGMAGSEASARSAAGAEAGVASPAAVLMSVGAAEGAPAVGAAAGGWDPPRQRDSPPQRCQGCDPPSQRQRDEAAGAGLQQGGEGGSWQERGDRTSTLSLDCPAMPFVYPQHMQHLQT